MKRRNKHSEAAADVAVVVNFFSGLVTSGSHHDLVRIQLRDCRLNSSTKKEGLICFLLKEKMISSRKYSFSLRHICMESLSRLRWMKVGVLLLVGCIVYFMSLPCEVLEVAKSIHEIKFVDRTQYLSEQELDVNNLYTKGPYWKKLEPFTHKDPSGFNKFVIFDSDGFSGSLQFLDNNIPLGWSVFVINNVKDAQLKTCPNCISFSKSTKASKVLEKIRQSHRDKIDSSSLEKMAALIFAYKSNAPWIYVTDKRIPVPFVTLTRTARDHPERGIVYYGHNRIFQPCGHYMDPYTWGGKGPQTNQSVYVLTTLPTSPIYQIVDNCRRQGMKSDWERYLDENAPTPYVMPGQWAALDFQNILVPRNSSWSLIASIKLKTKGGKSSPAASTTSGALSLLVQRLLWETNSVVGFVPGTLGSNVNLTRTMKCPTCHLERSLADVLDRGKGKALDTLTGGSWCDAKWNVLDCMEKAVVGGLVKELSGGGGKSSTESLVRVWAKLLKEFEITQGVRSPLTQDKMKLRSNGNYILFTPAKSLHGADAKGHTLPPNTFEEVCTKYGRKYSGFIPNQHPEIFNSVVLVISFNFPTLVSSIPYIDFVYGRHFKHVVYCSTSIKTFEDLYQKKYRENPVTFIEVDIHRGYHGHLCAAAVSEMNFNNATGFLYFSDDVIVNTWNLYNQPFYLPWFQTDIRVVNLGNKYTRGHRFGKSWYPWYQPTGRAAITKSINQLKSLRNDSRIGAKVNWFLRNLQQMSSGCDNCIAYYDADLYYIPSYMAGDFRFFIPYFKDVFQEMSVPTLLAGITPQADLNIYRLRGYYLVDAYRRDNFDKVWSNEELFVHPVKYSRLTARDPKGVKLFCNLVRRTDEDLRGFKHDLKTQKS